MPSTNTDSYVAPASWSAGDDDGHRRARPRRRLKPEREPGVHLRHQRIRQGVTGPPSPSGPTAPCSESKSLTSKAAWPPTAPKTTAELSVRPAAPSPISTTDATKFLARLRQAHRQDQARRRLHLRDQLPRLGRAQARVFRQAPFASPPDRNGAPHCDPKCLAQRISPITLRGRREVRSYDAVRAFCLQSPLRRDNKPFREPKRFSSGVAHSPYGTYYSHTASEHNKRSSPPRPTPSSCNNDSLLFFYFNFLYFSPILHTLYISLPCTTLHTVLPSDLATCQVVPLLASLISANKIECYHTCTAIRIRLHTRVPVPLRKAIRSPLILCAVKSELGGAQPRRARFFGLKITDEMRRRSTGSFPSNGAEYTTNCTRSAPPRRERKHSLQFVPNTATRIAQRSPSRTSFTRTCDDLKGVSDESERSGGLGPGIFFLLPCAPTPLRDAFAAIASADRPHPSRDLRPA